MAGDKRLSARFGAETTDFKTGIVAINREMRVLESSFRANVAGLGDWSKSATGLEQRAKSLKDQLELQQKKVQALTEEYQRQVAAEGENSRAAQDALIALNKQAEALGKMESELGNTETALEGMAGGSDEASGAVEELGQDAGDTSGKLGEMEKSSISLEGVLKGVAGTLAAVAGAVVGVGGAISALVLNAANAAGELVDLSAKTEISTTRLQELAYVGDQVGSSQETIVSSLGKLTRSMDASRQQAADYTGKIGEAREAMGEWQEKVAKLQGELDKTTKGTAAYQKKLEELKEAEEGLSEARENVQQVATDESQRAFNRLGVAVVDANGKLRDNEAVFADVIDALGRVDNATERDALAMEIFGKSAQELNPLIAAGAEEIAKLSAEAHELGAVVAEDDVAALESFGDSLAGLKAGLQGTLATLAGAFLPGFQNLATQAQGYLKTFGGIVREAKGDVGQMASGVGGLVAQIVSDLAKQGPQMLKAGLTILQGIIKSVITLLPTLLPMVIELISTLIRFLVDNLPMIIQAAVQIVVALALGIAQALPELIPIIAEVIPVIILALIDSLPLLVDAALQIILALAKGLIVALPALVAAIPELIVALEMALRASKPALIQAGKDLLATILLAIAESLPALQESARNLIAQFAGGIAAAAGAIAGIGKAIVDGIWEGIKTQWATLTTNVGSLFTGLVDWLRKLLGIKSPSTVFAGIGENMAMGMGQGFDRAFEAVERQVRGAVRGMADTVSGPNVNLAQAGAGMGAGGGMQINLGGITILAGAGADAAAIGQAARKGARQGLVEAMRSKGMM